MMPDQDIQLSKAGIRISYLRFLSDSAAGQIVILIALAVYYFPLLGAPLRQDNGSSISTEVKVLVAVLLVLLSSPLGLAINSTSWFLLSWLQVRLQHFWFRERKLCGQTLFKYLREEYQIELTKRYFSLSDDNWYARTQFIKQTLHLYRPYIVNSLDHIRGIRTLFRNVSFLALVFYVAFLIFEWQEINFGDLGMSLVWLLLIFSIPMIISSLLGFHYTSHVLYRAYILMLESGREQVLDENFNQDILAGLSGDVAATKSDTLEG